MSDTIRLKSVLNEFNLSYCPECRGVYYGLDKCKRCTK